MSVRSLLEVRWALSLLVMLSAGAPSAHGAVEDARVRALEEKARGYIEVLLGPDPAAIDSFEDTAMQGAMTRDEVGELRHRLAGQLGAVEEIGRAWHEGSLRGYERFRVPISFEKATTDARVVIDARDRVAGLFFVPHTEPPGEASSLAPPGEEREVTVGIGENALPGFLLIPEGQGPFPGVVLVHGSGPNDRDETIGPNKPFRDLAWGLARNGIASLRYDKRSLAHPDTLLAIGSQLTVVEEVVLDARQALAVLAAAPGVDPSRTFLIGHSLGGTVLPRIPDDETRVAGMVVLAGATLPLPETIVRQTRYIAGLANGSDESQRQRVEIIEQQMARVRQALEGKIEAPGGYFLGAPVGYYADLEAHPPEQIAAGNGLPILVLQGERDYQVTMDDFALWREALDDEVFACLHSYAALDHLLREGSGPSSPADYEVRGSVSAELISDVSSWLLEGRCPGGESP